MLGSRFARFVLLSVLAASPALASPWPQSLKHMTNRVRSVDTGLSIDTFHPESTLETYGAGIDHPLSKRATTPPVDETAVEFIANKLGISKNDISVRSSFNGQVSNHAFVRQRINGVNVANAVANVAVNKDDKVVSFGNSFIKPKGTIPSTTPTVSLQDAIAVAEQKLGGKFNNHPPTVEFFAKQDGTVALTHVIQIENDATGAWVEAFVDAHTKELVSIVDFVTKASYKVLPIQKQAPTEGFETLTDPQNLASSPQGWHNDGTTSTTTTAGNNVVAFKGSQTATSSQTSSGLNFIFTQNPNTSPTTSPNVDVARVNAFYIVNTIHDITYQYGFTESAFNFQNSNFGKGGKGNDRVTVSIQDSAGTNNADFSTPADGQSGRMRMFLWTFTNPQRDGAIENDIVAHENTHGLSNRLTGGGTGRCLQTTEAGGMGEGWSDAFAEWTEQKSASVPDFTLGSYVINDPAGIRSHPYSTSKTVNPLTYQSIQTLNEVHDIGEIWANTLHNVYAALVAANGFSTTAKTNATGNAGNVVFMHLFVDAMALQPCNPTFLTARSAWIQADANRYGGANTCTLWKAFASRGLGINAANHVDNSQIPSNC